MDATGDGEWAIALRSGLLDGATVRLFAGRGIVADSDPEAELAEAQAKFVPVRDALSESRAHASRHARLRGRPAQRRILIWVNGELVPRERAVVSVFDSGFVLGDGVWEGLRVRAGHPAFLERHLDRLFEGAKAIMLDIGRSRDELTEAIYATLRANDMTDGVHVRLMVTRGVKRTPYQDPRVTIGPATVVIIAEHKEPLPATVTDGITLFTTHVRRAAPDTLDPKLNAHSKLNDITACIQAYTAGADEALMLDPHGFVATCNSTHFFIVGAPTSPRC